MKKIFSFLVLCFAAVVLLAKPVSREFARTVANNFLNGNSLTAPMSILSDYSWNSTKSSDPIGFYIFNISEGGFILISADDEITPVLGYSLEATFGGDSLPPAFEAMLNSFSSQIQYITASSLNADLSIQLLWEKYSNPLYTNPKSVVAGPLLTCLWDQGTPYNVLCPVDNGGPGGRVYAGCVATMMGMTMYYYRYPTQPTGTHGYNSDYGYLSVDFGQSHYMYEQMPSDLGAYNYDVAKLLYDCGVSVDMMYSPNGSGAYMDDALNAMKTHFGFNASSYLDYKDDYSETNWKNLLKTQLDAGHPLPYAGYDVSAGHAFVCDGYDSNDLFHFNWGWSGAYNGYFNISNLNPGYNFSTGQQAFINCYPAAVTFPTACGNYTMNARSGSIVVGQGDAGYLNNQNCSWAIAPSDSVSEITITFNYFSTENNNDVVTIYSGSDASASVVGAYSGSAIPQSITINGNKAFVTFTSNGSVTDHGFHADYYGNVPQFCSILLTLTDSAGTIKDGSESYSYANNATCRWKILPPNATAIQFDFMEFGLENGMDFLYIYDYVTESLIGTLTGNTIPQSLVVYSSSAMVVFRSNNNNPDAGFKLNYHSLVTGLEQYPGLMMYLYENSSENPVLHLEKFPAGTYQLRVCDITGKEVFAAPYSVFDAQTEIEIPFEGSSSGLYLIHLSNNQLTRTLKYSR